MAHDVRLQSDPVARFLEDQINDGMLVQDTNLRIRTTELYMMYQEWSRRLGERVLGSRRFTHRVTSSFPDLSVVRVQGNYFWSGLARASGVSAMGMFKID